MVEFVAKDNVIGFLQEYAQKHLLVLPDYVVIDQQGSDHCKEFTVSCKFDGYSISGSALSKKAAKKEAANNMLTFLNSKEYFKNDDLPVVLKTDNKNVDIIDAGSTIAAKITSNPVGTLQEYCMKNRLRAPVYQDVVGASKDFTISCSLGNVTTYGSGSQKKSAKAAAASAMLKEDNLNRLRDTLHMPEITAESVRIVSNPIVQVNQEVLVKKEIETPDTSVDESGQLPKDVSTSPTQSFIEA